MIVMKSDDCLADNLRAIISHRRLRTLILDLKPVDIEKMSNSGKTWNSIESLLEIEELNFQMKELSNIMIDGFSPSQLVNTLTPFQTMSDLTKSKMKTILHELYVEATNINNIKKQFIDSALTLTSELQKLENAWNSNKTDIGNISENIFILAQSLLCILDAMPKGIVLP